MLDETCTTRHAPVLGHPLSDLQAMRVRVVAEMRLTHEPERTSRDLRRLLGRIRVLDTLETSHPQSPAWYPSPSNATVQCNPGNATGMIASDLVECNHAYFPEQNGSHYEDDTSSEDWSSDEDEPASDDTSSEDWSSVDYESASDDELDAELALVRIVSHPPPPLHGTKMAFREMQDCDSPIPGARTRWKGANFQTVVVEVEEVIGFDD